MMVRGGNEPVRRIMSLPGLGVRGDGRRLDKLEYLLLPCRSGQLNVFGAGNLPVTHGLCL